MMFVLKKTSKNKKIQAHTLKQLVKAFEKVRAVEKSKLNNVTKLQQKVGMSIYCLYFNKLNAGLDKV